MKEAVGAYRQVLRKLKQKIMRGIYYRSRFSELLQEYESPSPHQAALAIARKYNWNIAPSGTTALNILGLSAQMPAKRILAYIRPLFQGLNTLS